MATTPYVLGIDLGTTTCRCALFDLEGHEIVCAYREIRVHYPRPLWAEVDPDEWWRSTVVVIREALARSRVAPEQIAGIGLSGLMHAPVLLDRDGLPIAPAMLWMDQRCAPQVEALTRERQRRKPGSYPPFVTAVSAPKLRWLADTHPELLAQADTFLLPKDFVRYRLTGVLGSDSSDAGGTGLYDRERGEWDWDVVELAHVPQRILPELQPSISQAGRVTAAAAAETGLAPGTIVAIGGADTLCTQMGAGRLRAHEICMYLGTAAWIALVDGPGSDGRPMVAGFGATATTGAALRWARDLLVGESGADVSASYDHLTHQAMLVPPGAEGLFFLPHLMGERGPKPDPLARGALVGLTLRHGREHVVRATLEGTAFHLRRLIEARAAEHWPGAAPCAGVACGGAAHSPFWMQILADTTGLALRVPAVVEAGVLGAAMFGSIAAGLHTPASASQQMVHIGRIYQPDAANADCCNALYNRYCQLDDLLAPWFRTSEARIQHPEGVSHVLT